MFVDINVANYIELVKSCILWKDLHQPLYIIHNYNLNMFLISTASVVLTPHQENILQERWLQKNCNWRKKKKAEFTNTFPDETSAKQLLHLRLWVSCGRGSSKILRRWATGRLLETVSPRMSEANPIKFQQYDCQNRTWPSKTPKTYWCAWRKA